MAIGVQEYLNEGAEARVRLRSERYKRAYHGPSAAENIIRVIPKEA